MSHIDEGVLHAYLDGALDDYPVAEAERVREHLERCEACRVLLEEERALRARAQSILGLAVPEVDIPPLEELRARARHRETPARPPASARLSRIGWAASVILALGTGWLLRGDTGPVERGVPQAAAPRSEVAEARAETTGGRFAESPPVVGTGPAPTGGGAPDADATTSEEVAGATAVERELPRPPGPDVALVADVPLQRDVQSLAPLRSRLLATGPLTEAAASAPDAASDAPDAADDVEVEAARRRSDPDAVVTSASRLTPLAGLAPPVAARSEPERDREEVDYPQRELYSLVVPGLELIEIRFRGEVRPEGQVVLQRLRSGDTLTVIHLPPGVDPATVEAADPADLQVSVQRATGSILMRAPLSEEELLDLMERLLGAP